MMRCLFSLSLPALLFLAAPALAADDKPADAEPKPAPKDKPVATAKFLAKVLSTNTSNKTLKVELDEPIITINRGHANSIVYWQRRLVDATRDKNPKNRIKRVAEAQNHIAYHEARLYERHDRLHQVDVQSAENVSVRTLSLPPVTDDKGKPRKYTAEELKQLKGDSKETGYSAAFADIHAGQIIEVTIGKPGKTKPAAAAGEESLDPAKNKDKPPAAKPGDNKPLAIRLVIVR
jgi:hypothetical protein